MESIMDEIKLVINIKHKSPVRLVDLTLGLNGLASIYNDFTKQGKEAHLLVKEVRQGSIEIDLLASCALSPIPLFTATNNIIQFCDYIKLLISCLKNGESEEIESTHSPLPNPTSNDFKNFGKVINIPQGSHDLVSCHTQNIKNSTIYNKCQFSGLDATEMLYNLSKMGGREDFSHSKQLFKWVQTNFNNLKIGNRGIIGNIFEKPLRVIFDDDNLKSQMTTTGDDGVEWQNKYYTVDVEVQTGEDKRPMQYKITNNYPEDSFEG